MKNIKLTISYNGKNYAGFQIQKNACTIQQVLQEVATKIFKQQTDFVASGRTDAGVHANGQVVCFFANTQMKTQNILRAFNSLLPNDIRVLKVAFVAKDFHARFSAHKKVYRYCVCTKKVVLPFETDFCAHYGLPLNFEALQRCVAKIVGTHNFKAFCKSENIEKNYERTIFDFKVKKKSGFIVFEICGNGFLYNMVRIIVGTLLDIASGKLSECCIEQMFETQNRQLGGKTAEAKGLFLHKVVY